MKEAVVIAAASFMYSLRHKMKSIGLLYLYKKGLILY